MELYQLKSFIIISQTGNLTRAAEKLHISQSALSSQIKALEGELGLILFKRNARGMSLTIQGGELLEQAVKIIEDSDNLLQKAKNLRQNITGSLKLGLNTDPSFLQTSSLNKLFSKLMPGVEVGFSASDTIQTHDMLRTKKIDIGYMYGDKKNRNITNIQLFNVDVVIVIPNKFINSKEIPDWVELCNLPWIWAYEDCPFHITFQAELDKYNLTPKKTTYAVDEHIIYELVRDGQGLAMMRPDEAEKLVNSGHIIIWDKCRIKVPLSIACLTSRKDEILIQAACKIIINLWKG